MTMHWFPKAISEPPPAPPAPPAAIHLTDEERAAIEDAAGLCEEHAEEYDGTVSTPIADTLRKLLERLT